MDLNTLSVINARSSKDEGVYVYDLTCSSLFFWYYAKSKIELKRVLKIHPKTSSKYVDSKIPYLNSYY